MTSIEEFFTSDRAAEGVKVYINRPNGEKTKEWLLIAGVDCDEFRIAENIALRKIASLASETDDIERAKKSLQYQSESIAALILDWSLSQECNEANKRLLLSKSPQIQEQINSIAANRRLFFTLQSGSSNGTRANSSGSTGATKAQKPPE